MKVLLVGYGYYVLGNKDVEGGTVLPSLFGWAMNNSDQELVISILVKNDKSKVRAESRLNDYLRNNIYISHINNVVLDMVTYSEVSVDSAYDAGIIAVPEIGHVDVFDFVSKYTDHIMIVKPVGIDCSDVDVITELADTRKIDLYVDFHKRFDESNILLINTVSADSAKKMTFKFSYGQKSEMPLKYFRAWSESSNPYQYLAPHYIDIIGCVLRRRISLFPEIDISGSISADYFETNQKIASLVAANLVINVGEFSVRIISDCNWMEPSCSPFNSRQRIEYLSENYHYISEQDNRGQMNFTNSNMQIPNPHYMVYDDIYGADGYGKRIYENFLNAKLNRFNKDRLPNIYQYRFVSKIIDYVNKGVSQ